MLKKTIRNVAKIKSPSVSEVISLQHGKKVDKTRLKHRHGFDKFRLWMQIVKTNIDISSFVNEDNDVVIERMQDGLLSHHASLAMIGCSE